VAIPVVEAKALPNELDGADARSGRFSADLRKTSKSHGYKNSRVVLQAGQFVLSRFVDQVNVLCARCWVLGACAPA
jgi:hypothetical protein